jgi:hypothetical protein
MEASNRQTIEAPGAPAPGALRDPGTGFPGENTKISPMFHIVPDVPGKPPTKSMARPLEPASSTCLLKPHNG